MVFKASQTTLEITKCLVQMLLCLFHVTARRSPCSFPLVFIGKEIQLHGIPGWLPSLGLFIPSWLHSWKTDMDCIASSESQVWSFLGSPKRRCCLCWFKAAHCSHPSASLLSWHWNLSWGPCPSAMAGEAVYMAQYMLSSTGTQGSGESPSLEGF